MLQNSLNGTFFFVGGCGCASRGDLQLCTEVPMNVNSLQMLPFSPTACPQNSGLALGVHRDGG